MKEITKILIFMFTGVVLVSVFLIGHEGRLLQGKLNQSSIPSCIDTDGGKIVEKFGATQLSDDKFPWGLPDFCSDGKTVIEKFCKNGKEEDEYIACPVNTVCNQGECVALDKAYICGNGICENQREQDSGCFFDCGYPPKGKIYNETNEVSCGCKDSDYLSIASNSPWKKVSCESCSRKNVSLFPDYLAMQTKVHQCLSDYFDYKPPRIANWILDNPLKEICNQKNGCEAFTGHIFDAGIGISWQGYPGYVHYGEKEVIASKDIIVDEHEMTHIFLYNMLHGLPSWLDEGVAIQVKERLHCHPQEDQKGDAYLQEVESEFGISGGINMSDGTVLNEDYYIRLRSGKTNLADSEKGTGGSGHKIGTLWVMGLKLDYGCEEKCIAKIIKKLKVYRDEQCQNSQEECGLSRVIVFNISDDMYSLNPKETNKGENKKKPNVDFNKGNKLNLKSLGDYQKYPKYFLDSGTSYWTIWRLVEPLENKIIKQVTDEVVGQDTSALFELLELSESG